MPLTTDNPLLDALLDSWDRNNAILTGLLRVLPEGALAARAAEDSPSVAQMFHHMHYVRLVFLEEDALEFAKATSETEWSEGCDVNVLAESLKASAAAVREAVRAKLESGTIMEMHYDHPVLFLQHMVWHEAYHHGQIKLALKLAEMRVSDDVAGRSPGMCGWIELPTDQGILRFAQEDTSSRREVTPERNALAE